MERAARVIHHHKYSPEIISGSDVVRGIWPAAVGKTIARHTGRITVVRNKLVVEVEDAIWQRQLFSLTRQIVDRLQKLMGSTDIQDLEFRVGVPRRAPQREESPRSAPEHTGLIDEAEQIQDPVLKKVYRLSRKKATA
jgi:Dna[CI] antecedent, DciA